MSVDKFSLEQFHEALMRVTDALDIPVAAVAHTGVQGSDHHFVVFYKGVAPGHEINFHINSSVKSGGWSADSGEDSIRIWITDGEGNSLGNKTQRWVTRQPGWEQRMLTTLEKVKEMADSICHCAACNSLEKVFVVKHGKPENKGRLFKKCLCNNSFQWLDEAEPCEGTVPACPDCGDKMVKRNGRYGEFWGCANYPRCKATVELGQEDTTPAERIDRNYKVQAQTSKPKFVPSHYQQAIFDWIDEAVRAVELGDEEHNIRLVVKALAGTGKTTTGVEMMKRLPKHLRAIFLAFNRHIAKELKKKLPRNIRSSTVHSLGFVACMKAWKITTDDVEEHKSRKILEQYLDKQTMGELIPPIVKLVSLTKATLSNFDDEALAELASYYSVELNGSSEYIFEATRYVLKKSMEMTNVVDYDDMVWLPVVHNIPCEKFDFVFVDEAQDLNKANLMLILKHMTDSTIFVAVGDEYQSLYGFRGADVDSIPNIIERTGADVLPLSISYRCPKVVVDLINEHFPHIPFEAADNAIEGEILNYDMNSALWSMSPGDLVLCRTNAPLVKPCFELIKRGVKAIIVGRDIGRGLINLIRKMNAVTLIDALALLAEYRDRETAKLLAADKNMAAQNLSDKVETIVALSDGCETIEDVETKITSVFDDKVEGVAFSSVHRAKGLESTGIYILERDLMPHPMAEQEWELQQEENIEYVAYSRTKAALVFVQ